MKNVISKSAFCLTFIVVCLIQSSCSLTNTNYKNLTSDHTTVDRTNDNRITDDRIKSVKIDRPLSSISNRENNGVRAHTNVEVLNPADDNQLQPPSRKLYVID